jgi:hypothetical protein
MLKYRGLTENGLVDMSNTKHLKTVIVSNFVVRNSNRCGETPRAPWRLHMQTTFSLPLQQEGVIKSNVTVDQQLEHQ